MTASDNATCTWCGRAFSSRIGGGKRQRFCCAGHRLRFWRSLRKWASSCFDAGLISIDDLRRSSAEAVVNMAAKTGTRDRVGHSNVHAAQNDQKQA